MFEVFINKISPARLVTEVFGGRLQDEDQTTIEDNISEFAEFIGSIVQVAVQNSFKELGSGIRGEIDSTGQVTKVYKKEIQSNLSIIINYSQYE